MITFGVFDVSSETFRNVDSDRFTFRKVLQMLKDGLPQCFTKDCEANQATKASRKQSKLVEQL